MTKKKKLTPGKERNTGELAAKAGPDALKKQDAMLNKAVADLTASEGGGDVVVPMGVKTPAEPVITPDELPEPKPPVEDPTPVMINGEEYPEGTGAVIDMRPDPETVRANEPVTITRGEWESTMSTLNALAAALNGQQQAVPQMVMPSVQVPVTPVAPPPPTGNIELGTLPDPLMEDYTHTMEHNPGMDRWILTTKHIELPTSKGVKIQEWVGEPSNKMIAKAKKHHMVVLTAKYYEELARTV